MIRPLLPLLLLLGLATSAHAQIYADVSVSHGTSALGTFRILLHHDKTPRTVANFIGLATGLRNWIDPATGKVQVATPYYDGLIFHRLIHNFIIQGGDPLGNGSGGPGYIFQDEFDQSLSHSGSYIISMANSGANSNGSQFFITLSAPTFLDNKHSIFGEVIDDATYPNSRALIDSFKDSGTFPTSASDLPDSPITINSVTLSGPDLAAFDINAPALMLPSVTGKSISINHDSTDSSFSLIWAAQRKFDYPLFYSTNLNTWALAANILSMNTDPNLEIGINAIATTPAGFYLVSEIDYSAVHEAPQNILSSGSVLDLEPNGGTLRLTFDDNAGDTWQFIYADGVTPTETGSITSSNQSNTTSYRVITTAGIFINSSQTYARSLSLRQITVFLDGPAGPDLLTVVQPALSFHSELSGWFDGGVNTDSLGSVTFRGEFTYTPPLSEE